MSQPAPARVRASADGPTQSGGEAAVALWCEDGGGLGQPAQLGQRLGQGRPGRVQAADDQPQAAADPGPAEQGADHGAAPEVRSGVVRPGLSLRNRSTLAGRVMRDSQTNADGEDPADQEQDELADGGVVGGEVAAVEQGQAQHEGAGGADDDLDRGAGACPAGLDPQAHGGLVPGRRGQRAQQLPEPLGLVLGGQIRAATTRSQVGSATSSAKARRAGARRSPSRRTARVATSARIGSGARGAVATMACSRPAEPAMVSRSISAHPATASMRPTATLCRLAPPNRPGAPQPARPASTAPTGQPVAAPTTTAAPTARPRRRLARSTLRRSSRRVGRGTSTPRQPAR